VIKQRQGIERAALVLEDGSIFEGEALGHRPASGVAAGEVVFNTALTGYQEVIMNRKLHMLAVSSFVTWHGVVVTGVASRTLTTCSWRQGFQVSAESTRGV